ncbi:hypothetical protein NIG5292_00788 [Nereida ignava]|uniref:Uncharacterized protein n=1 Tax=Nereida ignava TaxID=282199 RepID=A0A0U1NJ62_9RHOB|nr:hypothetical protein [Nereida ignava]CRK74751.1 hypothetical protein NIG5292_00788 [Nereida ignava]SFJ95686.1 hypothetical protein SAMN02745667_02880 [Nereida ignava DSM 16309]
MSVSRVKELFYDATNSKVSIGSGDDEYLQRKLREAHRLAVSLQDQVWQYIPAYRLSHLLFREAKTESDFTEIMELLEHAEKSDSNYISLNSSLLKFAAMHRLRLLGTDFPTETQSECAESIVRKISTASNQNQH